MLVRTSSLSWINCLRRVNSCSRCSALLFEALKDNSFFDVRLTGLFRFGEGLCEELCEGLCEELCEDGGWPFLSPFLSPTTTLTDRIAPREGGRVRAALCGRFLAALWGRKGRLVFFNTRLL